MFIMRSRVSGDLVRVYRNPHGCFIFSQNLYDLTPPAPSLQGKGEQLILLNTISDLRVTKILPSPCGRGGGGEVTKESALRMKQPWGRNPVSRNLKRPFPIHNFIFVNAMLMGIIDIFDDSIFHPFPDIGRRRTQFRHSVNYIYNQVKTVNLVINCQL